VEPAALTGPTFAASKTALVVIDLQHDIVELATAPHPPRDAYERDYRQFLVEAAMSGLDELSHQNAIERIFPHIGHVLRTDAVLAMMTRPTQP
jgi:nicotinamidase-related amidase